MTKTKTPPIPDTRTASIMPRKKRFILGFILKSSSVKVNWWYWWNFSYLSARGTCYDSLTVPAHHSATGAKNELFTFAIWASWIFRIKLDASMYSLRVISLSFSLVFVNLESPYEFIGALPYIIYGNAIIFFRFRANSHYCEGFVADWCHSRWFIYSHLSFEIVIGLTKNVSVRYHLFHI